MSLILAQLKPRQRWGLAIYRTSYTSEDDWVKFKTLLNNWTARVLEDYGPMEAPLLHSWQQMWWFDDRELFEGASIPSLREHFQNTWFIGLSSDDRERVVPEHYIFLVVDAEVLDSVRPHSVDIDEHKIYRNIHSQVFVIETFMASMTSESEF
jgi:hypothetical protein